MPTPPILVIDEDGEDLLSFDTEVAAAGWMEPPEVAESAFRVFDAAAHEATLSITKWDVVITAWSNDERSTDLRRLLTTFLRSNGASIDDAAPLDHLVRSADAMARRIEDDRTHPQIAVAFSSWLRNRRPAT